MAALAGVLVPLGAVLTVPAQTAAAAAPPVGSCSTPTGDVRVCFSYGEAGHPDSTVYDDITARVAKLGNTKAPAGKKGTLELTVMNWTKANLVPGPDLVDAVRGAAARGVKVTVVMRAYGSAGQNDVIKRLKEKKVTVKLCSKGCISKRGVMHDKFLAYEGPTTTSTATTRFVLQSSMNFVPNQLAKGQNSVTLWNATIYRAYHQRFQKMLGKKVSSPSETVSGKRKVYFFPRKDDVVAGVLQNVSCGNKNHRRVWVTASKVGSRDAVLQRLATLRKKGCEVRMIVLDGADETQVQKALGKGSGPLVRQHDVHSKEVLIDARYNGKAQKIVFTGSHNLTGTSLKDNDESLLKITDAKVYAAYAKQFSTLWKRAS